ncbi:hypothetical protein EJB05_29607 [Eragrostis curvula]|uniref:Uncharacterized protein n=1 Tax=Eragrostis curvula TaxID=38414 RepID=A0A5J9UT53_9POAL|nr:hypothetical protein EJB05_29607 [Eragrostis curvula]
MDLLISASHTDTGSSPSPPSPNSSDSSRPAGRQANSNSPEGRQAKRSSNPAAGLQQSGAMDEKIIDVPAPLPVTSSMDKKKEKKAASIPFLSVEEVFKWAPFQLQVKAFKKNKYRFQMPLLTVQGVLAWALFTFGSVAVTACILAAIAFANIPNPCSESQSCWIPQPPDLTPAQGFEVESFAVGFLWFTVPQAAAATVGLLLSRRRARSRWSLAFVAVVSAAVAHYMQSRSVLVSITADPGDILYMILAGGGAVVFVAGDLLSILSLLIGGTE